jgi:multiple sugar transport system ATP-binding protein
MAGVVLAGLSKVYPGGAVACDQIDLEARDGEFLVLVGPSGSGKSTTLRLIAGLEKASAGSISLGGRIVNDVAPKQRDVAMMFQSHALYPHWNVYKNMAFGAELRQSRSWLRRAWWSLSNRRRANEAATQRRELRSRVLQAARDLEIEALLDRLPGDLSGGEAQRVALGRALVRRPALFLFDEPLSNVDAQLRAAMRRQLKEFQQRLGTTMIYVTHDQAEALALGDRIAVLRRGQIEQLGPPQEIYDRPANRFVAEFVGSPPMNFFEGRGLTGGGTRPSWRLSAGGWSIDVASGWWQGKEGGQPAFVGLRAEDVHLAEPAEEPALVEEVPRLLATVRLVEHQGDTCVVGLVPVAAGEQSENSASPECRGAVLLGKTRLSSGLMSGEQVIAWFDMRRAHWFDGKSGRNLRQP